MLMKNKDLISIIIPVYNGEKYIAKCMEAVLKQTYAYYEVILIDDHSQDRSYELLKEYQENPKIQLYQNEQNLGAAVTRNRALNYAKGTYIGFLDVDDFIEENYYELLYRACIQEQTDLALASIMCIYESESYKNRLEVPPLDKQALLASGYVASPCNKLMKRELLEKYPFQEGIINEDITAMIPLIIDCENYSVCPEAMYYYVQHQNSVQNACVDEKKLQLFQAVDIVWLRIKDKKEQYQDAIIYSQLLTFLLYRILENKDEKNCKIMMRKYHDSLKQYPWKKNKYLKQHLAQLSSKNRFYYQLVLYLFQFRCYELLNFVIQKKFIYQKKQQKSVITLDITKEKLVVLAQRQSELPQPKRTISVVIPNYNYEKFLLERLESILKQTYKVKEIFILDDCSTDGSWELMEDLRLLLNPYIPVKTVKNETNQGVFKQWKKGFELAQGDYVWITEADDYSEAQFLEEVTKPCLLNSNIVLSYSNTSFIDQRGSVVYRNILSEIDVTHSGHWQKNYVIAGQKELEQYLYLNCTISNVSSTIIKRNIPLTTFAEAEQYKQIGDWMFYVAVMPLGDVAYCAKRLNYYRIHGLNVTSTMKKQIHYDEIKKWYQKLEGQVELSENQKSEIAKRKQFLEDVWKVK